MQNSNIQAVEKWNLCGDEANVLNKLSQNRSSSQFAPEKLSDHELYEKCRLYGAAARAWRQKFVGLLPEVYKRRLHEKKGFGSIFEFAKKLAGLSEDHVRRVLNIEERFRDKPILKEVLENGDVSVNKLARIVSIATPENQLFWATQAKVLPQSALETLVRDQKAVVKNGALSTASEAQNGLYEPKNTEKSVRAHMNPSQNLQNDLYISNELIRKLLELQNKGIDINALLLEFLEKRELEIAREKEKLSAAAKPTESRYIPVETRKLLQKEYGKKCSIVMCKKPATTIHHVQRFSLSQNHDPRFLAPLCKEHHAIAHSIDFKYHEARRVCSA